MKQSFVQSFQYTNKTGTTQEIFGTTLGIGEGVFSPGMSLRDYFAAKAMQAIAHESYRLGREFGYTQPDSLAEQAYKIADAMLAERSKSHAD